MYGFILIICRFLLGYSYAEILPYEEVDTLYRSSNMEPVPFIEHLKKEALNFQEKGKTRDALDYADTINAIMTNFYYFKPANRTATADEEKVMLSSLETAAVIKVLDLKSRNIDILDMDQTRKPEDFFTFKEFDTSSYPKDQKRAIQEHQKRAVTHVFVSSYITSRIDVNIDKTNVSLSIGGKVFSSLDLSLLKNQFLNSPLEQDLFLLKAQLFLLEFSREILLIYSKDSLDWVNRIYKDYNEDEEFNLFFYPMTKPLNGFLLRELSLTAYITDYVKRYKFESIFYLPIGKYLKK